MIQTTANSSVGRWKYRLYDTAHIPIPHLIGSAAEVFFQLAMVTVSTQCHLHASEAWTTEIRHNRKSHMYAFDSTRLC